jgi:hypothetical protein
MYQTSVVNRLNQKSELNRWSIHLLTNYSLSLAESQSLSREIYDHLSEGYQNHLHDGEIFWTTLSVDEPPGKPLKKAKKVRVKLTLIHPDDPKNIFLSPIKSQTHLSLSLAS